MAKVAETVPSILGWAADPAIEMLLPKELLAQIKIRKIEVAIRELGRALGAKKTSVQLGLDQSDGQDQSN